MSRFVLLVWILLYCVPAMGEEASGAQLKVPFDSKKDLLSLHYDHAPDRDDGHSAAADRMILQSMFGTEWVRQHVLPVSGAYGKNAPQFRPESGAVMRASWDDCGGWTSAAEDWDTAVTALTERWAATLEAGGDVWVKEGGQSDITADVVRQIRAQSPGVKTTKRIHVVQHSDWNERQTREAALRYTKANTDYIRIRDANRYLNKEGGDAKFIRAAASHAVFGNAWRAAFEYYDPQRRLDFSDSGELLYILGLGELGIDEVRVKFLTSP